MIFVNSTKLWHTVNIDDAWNSIWQGLGVIEDQSDRNGWNSVVESAVSWTYGLTSRHSIIGWGLIMMVSKKDLGVLMDHRMTMTPPIWWGYEKRHKVISVWHTRQSISRYKEITEVMTLGKVLVSQHVEYCVLFFGHLWSRSMKSKMIRGMKNPSSKGKLGQLGLVRVAEWGLIGDIIFLSDCILEVKP